MGLEGQTSTGMWAMVIPRRRQTARCSTLAFHNYTSGSLAHSYATFNTPHCRPQQVIVLSLPS